MADDFIQSALGNALQGKDIAPPAKDSGSSTIVVHGTRPPPDASDATPDASSVMESALAGKDVYQKPAAPTAQHPVAAPTGNFVTDASRTAGTIGTEFLGGILGLPSAAASGVDWLGRRAGLDIGAQKALGSIPGGNNMPLFPDPATAREMAYATTGATELRPESEAGRMALTGAEMVSQGGVRGLLRAGLGGLEKGAQFVPILISELKDFSKTLPSLFGGGAAAEAAVETPIGQEHPFFASLLAQLLGGKAANLAAKPVTKAVSAAKGTPAPENQAFTDLNVTPPSPFPQLQRLAAKGSDEVVKAQQETVGSWQDALNGVTQKLGPADTPQTAGKFLQDAAQKWLETTRARVNSAWDAFRMVAPPDTPVPVDNFRTALGGVLKDFGGADNLAKVLQPKLASRLQEALGQDMQPGNTLSWKAVQAVRSALGDMITGTEPVEGMSQGTIKRLYAALSDDMRDAPLRPEAKATFNMASARTATMHDLLDSHINDILKANTPEEASAAAMQGANRARGGGTRLQTLADQLPGGVSPLSSAQLQLLAGPDASPSTFAKNLVSGPGGIGAKGLSPEAFNALFGSPEARKSLQDLLATAKALRPTERSIAAAEKTDSSAGSLWSRLLAAREGADIGSKFGGLPGRVTGLLGGLFHPELGGYLGRVINSPAVAKTYMAPSAVDWRTAPYTSRLTFAGQAHAPDQ